MASQGYTVIARSRQGLTGAQVLRHLLGERNRIVTGKGSDAMRVTFRVDASQRMGGGHLMRCLTLADRVRQGGGDCHFVCAQIPRAMAARVARQGHKLTLVSPGVNIEDVTYSDHRSAPRQVQQADAERAIRVPGSAETDWIVVDHYSLDSSWEIVARERAGNARLMVIDDLANRPHACDILLDQTHGRGTDAYGSLLSRDCAVLAGSRFALLRPEFAAVRDGAVARHARERPVERLLISLGGTDLNGVTARVLQDVLDCDHRFAIDVVLGADAASLGAIRALAERRSEIRVHVEVDQMAPLMAQADMAIGAAGTSSWERCCVGLPTAAIVLAPNQRLIAAHLERAGAHRLCPSEGGAAFRAALNGLIEDPVARAEMSKLAAAITDGQGSERVYRAMLEYENARAG